MYIYIYIYIYNASSVHDVCVCVIYIIRGDAHSFAAPQNQHLTFESNFGLHFICVCFVFLFCVFGICGYCVRVLFFLFFFFGICGYCVGEGPFFFCANVCSMSSALSLSSSFFLKQQRLGLHLSSFDTTTTTSSSSSRPYLPRQPPPLRSLSLSLSLSLSFSPSVFSGHRRSTLPTKEPPLR